MCRLIISKILFIPENEFEYVVFETADILSKVRVKLNIVTYENQLS